MRYDFSEQTKRALAMRAAYRCSRPECGATTAGPQEDDSRAVNVGVAAHVTAASPRGPRFDAMLTSEERTAAANGVWLCQTCAKLIDSDTARFTIEVLQKWKIEREAEARRQLGLSNAQQPKRKLNVELTIGKLNLAGTPKFVFKVANPHERPATICGAGIEVPGTRVSAPAWKPEAFIFPPRLALPAQITDGQAVAFMESIDYFQSELHANQLALPVEVIGYVTDALGNRHESKPIMFASEDLLGWGD